MTRLQTSLQKATEVLVPRQHPERHDRHDGRTSFIRAVRCTRAAGFEKSGIASASGVCSFLCAISERTAQELLGLHEKQVLVLRQNDQNGVLLSSTSVFADQYANIAATLLRLLQSPEPDLHGPGTWEEVCDLTLRTPWVFIVLQVALPR